MVTFNTKIHKKGKSKESKLPNLMFDSDSDREGLLHEEDEYVYPDDKVKLIQKRNVRQDSKTNWKKSFLTLNRNFIFLNILPLSRSGHFSVNHPEHLTTY